MAGSTLETGTIFAGDFTIEGPLAAGGMGAVYRARQKSTGRVRALKVMHPDLVKDGDARGRFAQEARVGAHIDSAHVVEVHRAGIDDATGAPYLVMELLEGEDLHTRIERGGALGGGETRELFRQICHAIGAAHAIGVVHRDLKPTNLFLAEHRRAAAGDVEVKVLDFGIAKLTRTGPITAHVATAAGTMLGTPLWMAPEQSEGGAVGSAADVWALGLILYFVLTGRCFWRSGNKEQASLQEFFRELLVDPIPSPVARAGQQGTAFPANLEIVFRRCVARQPFARYPDATSFWLALDAALKTVPYAALSAAPYGPASAAATRAHDDGGSGIELADTSYARSSARAPVPVAAAFATTAAVGAPFPREGARALDVPASRGPALLDAPMASEPRRFPWFLSMLGGVAALGALVFGYQRCERGTFVGTCRLCTVEGESQTFANGPIPLSEIRHQVEELYPRLDARCLWNAKRGGRVRVRFSIAASQQTEHYRVINLRATPDDETSTCLAKAFGEIDFGAQPIMRHGATEVGYTLEFDPNH